MTTFLLVLWTSVEAPAASLRCGNDLIMPGDSTVEVLSRCGEPLSRDVVAVASSGVERETDEGEEQTLSLRTEKVELWVYDPGHGSLLRLLHFRGGKLVSIENAGRSDPLAEGTSRAQVSAGDTKAEVLRKWGEPAAKEHLGVRSTEIRRDLPDGDAESLTATSEKLERWIYEFGPGEFRRHVIFEAGRVVRVEMGERP